MIVQRSALLAQPAAHLFDVIEAAEHYPSFLPWCVGAVIISRDDDVVSADLQVRLAGMNFSMRTRNPKRRPEFMAIHLERGPFRRFEGEWHLTALSADACKVAFMLDYEFDSRFMTQAAGPVFRHAADTLMDAFVRHAQTLPVAPPPAAAPAMTMNDLTVGPELIDLHPSLARLAKLTGADVLSAAGYDRWASRRGHAMVVFTKDPELFDVPMDLVAVLPELQATAGGSLRIGLLPPGASRAIATRYRLTHWPVFVMLHDGQFLGAVEGTRDWEFYTAELLRLLAAAPGKPAVGDGTSSA